MLVLSRQRNQSAIIGDIVEVFVTLVRADRARLLVRHTAAGGRLTLSDDVEHDGEVGSSVDLPTGGSVGIVDVRGETVRLGFMLPKGTPLLRREVYDAITSANDQH
jgi:sRNA-binding carbon storage regulator CsrA